MSYYGRSCEVIIQLGIDAALRGLPSKAADNQLGRMAMEMIWAEPGKHLKAIGPFAWRGFWCFPDSGFVSALANLTALSIFLAFPLIALGRRRADWLAFSLLGVGLFWFYPILTHSLPRYSEPLIPLACVSLLVLMHALVRR
jgi:hypothetical protein